MKWFKRNSILLSRETHTGLGFWMGRTLGELDSWIAEYNEVMEELKKGDGNGSG